MSAAPRPAPRRERARAATIDEIKHTALDLMRSSGSIDIKFTDIARVMELTPPALYRYFADRDALLNVLIADAYVALGAAVAAARDAVPVADVWRRFLAIAQAYRHWARSEPQLFTLILGMPVAGYEAPEDGPTTEAAQGAMRELSRVFVDANRQGKLGEPMISSDNEDLVEHKKEKHHEAEEMSAGHFQAMLHCWASLHGFTTLEAYGHFDWLTENARDGLFVDQVALAARAAGISVP
ncbi:TetR/AcrR family transcriptional regulator [Virgisporangium aurantiacum]|uniref:TetR family transcriptional regulator n=1 Tax=Virgisporangium aurantiacum TaxID=175570 RepID=A0A8J3ZAR7_9ACTN|nr:TetR/AcrR family transcriptional regulator [Virgisporangium aurantiacum]GIJ60539.1 TetR family transcriptional regulator [Virgisporangium aurantiacum]